MRTPGILIAAPASGSGKTAAACALMAAFTKRGLTVKACKCGPDYIDPMFHREVLGVDSRNLDLFFSSGEELGGGYEAHISGADLAVTEGVMGYYDGMSMDSDAASSYDVSRTLGLPVLLVLPCRGASLSLAAVAKGMAECRPDSRIRGILLNRVSGMLYPRLKEMLERELKAMGHEIPVVGYVPEDEAFVLESRHLGLVLPSEIEELKDKLNRLADVLEGTLDIDLLVRIASQAPDLRYEAPAVRRIKGDVRIGLADDDTFCFTYEDNVELLERCGAEIVRFSPMRDPVLPDVDGIVLSGGYPELHCEELESNRTMMEDIRSKVLGGMPCIAECGGFMYLHERMEDKDGVMHGMCGVIPGEVRNTGRLSRFGYATFSSLRDDGVTKGGLSVKGHEFHYWDSDNCGSDWKAVKTGGREYTCLHDTGTMLAGYPHLYYYSNPEFATRFMERCLEYRNRRTTI